VVIRWNSAIVQGSRVVRFRSTIKPERAWDMNKNLLSLSGKVLEVWIANNGKVSGTAELDDVMVGKGTIKYTFVGKTATYHVVTNDDEITREIALWFAAAYHAGKLRIVHINLKDYDV
jgi:hypothetical protein